MELEEDTDLAVEEFDKLVSQDYRFSTVMNILNEGPSIDESEELKALVGKLDDNLDIFKQSPEQYFIMLLVS